jgi:predicted nucleotidyltransferase
MDTRKSLHNVGKSLEDWATRKAFVSRVWIFGSRVRGNHSSKSDLDVAIEYDPDGDEQPITRWVCEGPQWEKEIQLFIPYKLHLWRYHAKETPTIKKGLEEGSLLVYSRKSETAAG